jgi:hypothetical protein
MPTNSQAGQTRKEQPSFLPPDDAVLPALGRVSAWASTQNYEPAAISIFLQVADYWLVGHVLAHQFTIVSHEVPSNSTRKIKIPNACVGLGLHCVTPYPGYLTKTARSAKRISYSLLRFKSLTDRWGLD